MESLGEELGRLSLDAGFAAGGGGCVPVVDDLCDESAHRWFSADFLHEIAMVGVDVHFAKRVECGFALRADVILADAGHARTLENGVVLAHGGQAFYVLSAK